MSKRGSGSGLRWVLGIAAAGALGLASGADAEVSAKLEKQIQVMERILDEVLVDSQNVLVGSHNPSNGVYLDEFGVVFSIEAALLPMDRRGGFWDWNKMKMHKEDGKWVIDFNDDEDDSSNDKADKDDEDDADDEAKTDAELYQGAKEELITALLEYGDTLAGLQDNQSVAIAVFMDTDDFFRKRDISTLVIKAKMSDLRSGRSRKDMESRLVIDEY
jgi:hypothetical protein